MKNIKLNIALVAAFLLLFVACDTDVKHHIPDADAPQFISSSPETGAEKVKAGRITITVTYDKNIFFSTEDLEKISIPGAQVLSANVYGSSNTLTISALTNRETSYTLSIPEGVITGPNKTPAPAVSFNFATVALDKSLVNPSATPEAQKVYAYLLGNFESKTLSGMMAHVSWNTDEAERVFQTTGKYPALNCFDYVHLQSSGSGWIDYSDITPVSNWWNEGGLVKAMWHWNVPTVGTDISSTVVWTGEVAMVGWSNFVQLTANGGYAPSELFANAKVGDKLKIVTTDVLDGAQGSVKNSSWGEIAPGYDYFDISGDYEVEITDDVLASLQSGGAIIGGQNYTAIAVYLLSGGYNNEYAFYKDETNFNAARATIEGTWENEVFTKDLAQIAGYLKLLQEANIPVIWRPFHEAAGGWFWWGKDAESLKKMWIAMFDYFKAEEINNLIWVWTAEGNDEDWYPGDAYVDMVGRDLYGKNAAECTEEYTSIAQGYGNKMVSLSECGSVALVSEQWEAGARWSWFMPWYDNEGAEEMHATDDWWKDAMGQDYVITRESLPDFK